MITPQQNLIVGKDGLAVILEELCLPHKVI
jgi:hypothetical protein